MYCAKNTSTVQVIQVGTVQEYKYCARNATTVQEMQVLFKE